MAIPTTLQAAWHEYRDSFHNKAPRSFGSFCAGWLARKRAELATGYSAESSEALPLDCTRQLIHELLTRPFQYEWTNGSVHATREWSVQGFGMLRTYLDPAKRYRLNVWHSRFKMPHVSTIHDHPWHFTSWIIAGRFLNQRHTIKTVHYAAGRYRVSAAPPNFHCQRIKTGPGGGPAGEVSDVFLLPLQPELYDAGDTYHQRADEVHASHYEDGTVTLNDRTRLEDGEHARVFWPYGTKWVDAQPRAATELEVWQATRAALAVMDRESGFVG
jgi:hypothetical protein